MSQSEIEHFYPKTKQHWRKWLEKNHIKKDAVWLIHYKKTSGNPTLAWSDAVDEALCFGWIDSKAVSIDTISFKQYYSKRKARSTWSRVNKEKISQLMAENKMSGAGLNCVEMAKQNGSWTILDDVDRLIIPPDLAKALKSKLAIRFRGLSKSAQKSHLQDLVLAKTTETRNQRIKRIVEKLS